MRSLWTWVFRRTSSPGKTAGSASHPTDRSICDLDPGERQVRTAADLVNRLPEAELANLFHEFGEERHSRRIARRLLEERKKEPIRTTRAARGDRTGARFRALSGTERLTGRPAFFRRFGSRSTTNWVGSTELWGRYPGCSPPAGGQRSSAFTRWKIGA